MIPLLDKKCKACESYQNPFTLKETMEYLEKVKDWNLSSDGKEIEKNFEFNNFKDSIEFINKIADLAEAEGHHPDIFLHNYKNVRITLSTHNIKGLSENDFIMAAKIDNLYK